MQLLITRLVHSTHFTQLHPETLFIFFLSCSLHRMIRKSPWVNLHHHSTKFNLVCLMVSPVFLQGFIQFTLGFFLDFLLVLLYNWGQSQHTNMACASSLLATQLTRLRWKGHCPSSPDREFKNYVWIALQFPLLDLYS